MLTVKHVEKSFHESIIEVVSVSYQPRQPGNVLAAVFAYFDSGTPRQYVDGKIYVMNDKGRTIQQYDLDGDNFVDGQKGKALWLGGDFAALYELSPPGTYLQLAEKLHMSVDDVVAKAKELGIYKNELGEQGGVLWPVGEITALRQLRLPANYGILAAQLGRPLDEVIQKAKACDIFDTALLP